MDMVVDDIGSHSETETGVDCVGDGDADPGYLEGELFVVFLGGGLIFLSAANCAFYLLCSDQFDEVGDEEMAWDQCKE